MSELVWTCENGSIFCSEANGMRLVVVRAPGEGESVGGYRYQLVERNAAGGQSLVSGHRDDLRDAIDAAESAVRRFGTRGHSPYEPADAAAIG